MRILRSRRTFAIALVLAAFFVFLALGADSCDGTTTSQQQVDQTNNNDQSAALHKAIPYPKLTWSNELQNQYDWYERLNKKNEVGYIYVIAYNLVYGPYQTIGKCSSTESQYSAPMSIDTSHAYNGNGVVTVPAAQPDGSYGQNEAAIFCFLNDSSRTMIEFNSAAMGWVWSEKPLVGLPTVPGSAVIPNGH